MNDTREGELHHKQEEKTYSWYPSLQMWLTQEQYLYLRSQKEKTNEG